jgi:hypothetical protein
MGEISDTNNPSAHLFCLLQLFLILLQLFFVLLNDGVVVWWCDGVMV